MTGSLGSAEDEGAGGEGRDNKEDMDRVINQLSRAVMASRGVSTLTRAVSKARRSQRRTSFRRSGSRRSFRRSGSRSVE